MSRLQVQKIYKSYAGKKVLDGINFEISSKQILALLGPNGSGKSTTMQIILGLKNSDSGQVHKTQNIGYAAQELSFPASLKTKEVLKFVQAHFQKNLHEDLQKLKSRFDLEEFWNQETGGLSGGQKRRLAVACAFANKPDLVILDEPTTGLDLESKLKLWSEILNFRDEGGSVLLCSHDLGEVQKVADQVLLLQNGKTLFNGSIEQILSSLDLKQVSLTSKQDPNRFEQLENVLSIHRKNSSIEIITRNSDALIKEIVQKDFDFSDLGIANASLEQAFLRLQQESK